MWNLDVDDAYALPCGLIVVEAAQICARDQGVTFAELFATPGENRANGGATLLQTGGNDLEGTVLLFAAAGKFPCGPFRPRGPGRRPRPAKLAPAPVAGGRPRSPAGEPN